MNEVKYNINEFKDRLREVRTSNGFTQEEIAELLRISRDTYCNYERKKLGTCPSYEFLEKLCQIYDVSSDYFLFGVSSSMSKESKKLEYILSRCPADKKQNVLEIVEKIVLSYR